MTNRFVKADIWFHQDSDPGGGPEPYGWIRAYEPGTDKNKNYVEIWHKKNGDTLNHAYVEFVINISGEFKGINFYGDVKDSDTFSTDDVLAYPDTVSHGMPNELILIQGDEADTYINIKYTI
ncbi:hypothetical protein [Bacillus cereus]|uniref:hypothetical protein n=1 Tax=Bacillus cereus TaxID=1396 RepID=UPI0027D31006|nr:hypothetical protein [Bacillus cereus]